MILCLRQEYGTIASGYDTLYNQYNTTLHSKELRNGLEAMAVDPASFMNPNTTPTHTDPIPQSKGPKILWGAA